MRKFAHAALAALAMLGACTTSETDSGNAEPVDGGAPDVGPADTGAFDAGSTDAGPTDAGPTDTGVPDGGPSDAGLAEAGPTDSGLSDGGPNEAGAADSGLSDASNDADAAGPPNDLYIATCMTVLSNQDPKRALRFYVVATNTGMGNMSLVLKTFRGWEPQPPPGQPSPPTSVSMLQTLGNPINSVGASGTPIDFAAPLEAFTVEAEANSISGRLMTLEVALSGTITGGTIQCAGMSGKITTPISVMLDASQNVCLFKKAFEGAPVPSYQAADFVCP